MPWLRKNKMHSFYCEQRQGDLALLTKEDSRHAHKVLRLKEGDRVQVVLEGARYEAVLVGEEGTARLVTPLESTEAKVRITLYQGVTKGDRMDYTIQKGTELGVHAFYPCLMQRCVLREAEGKVERWQRIAREAGKQARRTVLPVVHEVLPFAALCARLAGHEQALVPWEEGGASLRVAYQGAMDVAVVIGPEGGITPEEIAAMQAKPVTLGPRILRTETAGPVAAAAILLLSGDME